MANSIYLRRTGNRRNEKAANRDTDREPLPVLCIAIGARSLRARRENIGATIAMLEDLRALKTSALDTTEREVA
jgi:hypothetical protein